MGNEQEFIAWLGTERRMGMRSAKDVLSRLKRAVGLLGTDALGAASVSQLNEVAAFEQCSMFIKSQLRRAVILYLEYSMDMQKQRSNE